MIDVIKFYPRHLRFLGYPERVASWSRRDCRRVIFDTHVPSRYATRRLLLLLILRNIEVQGGPTDCSVTFITLCVSAFMPRFCFRRYGAGTAARLAGSRAGLSPHCIATTRRIASRRSSMHLLVHTLGSSVNNILRLIVYDCIQHRVALNMILSLSPFLSYCFSSSRPFFFFYRILYSSELQSPEKSAFNFVIHINSSTCGMASYTCAIIGERFSSWVIHERKTCNKLIKKYSQFAKTNGNTPRGKCLYIII